MVLLKAIVSLLTIFVTRRLRLSPIFAFIALEIEDGNELFTAIILQVVLSAVWSTEYFGLAFGAFVSDVLVAEIDFRLKAEENLYPFKTLLLELFFYDSRNEYRHAIDI